ncbi:hypothetical protein ACEWY4_020945 [Coilia grayii]|uniref:C2 NT-type domain-containing protein n=1 Tax=Coilia grayii TaxID=363190 RepID=A0ABD1J7P3_9TELE
MVGMPGMMLCAVQRWLGSLAQKALGRLQRALGGCRDVQPDKLVVVWTRRSRRKSSKSHSWQPGIKNPYRGVVVWPVPENIEITVTLFKDPHAEEFEDKEWTFVIENSSPEPVSQSPCAAHTIGPCGSHRFPLIGQSCDRMSQSPSTGRLSSEKIGLGREICPLHPSTLTQQCSSTQLAAEPLQGMAAHERGSEGARERVSEGASERGSEGARERVSEGARERGSEGARERGSVRGAERWVRGAKARPDPSSENRREREQEPRYGEEYAIVPPRDDEIQDRRC